MIGSHVCCAATFAGFSFFVCRCLRGHCVGACSTFIRRMEWTLFGSGCFMISPATLAAVAFGSLPFSLHEWQQVRLHVVIPAAGAPINTRAGTVEMVRFGERIVLGDVFRAVLALDGAVVCACLSTCLLFTSA